MRAHPHSADAARRRVELAQVFARFGAPYRARHTLIPTQHRAIAAIEACRTEALGGHVERCEHCAALRYHYHSCRNRHCPKCQTRVKERWLECRRAELLPVPYYHLVFTLPHELNALAQGNPRLIYGLLFQGVADTLTEFGENPRWLGGSIAATLVLHTWGQTLSQHLHLHALVAGGALGGDGRWIYPRRGFLFPVKALSRVLRGKFVAGLRRMFQRGAFSLAGSTATLSGIGEQRRLIDDLHRCDWVVYAKRPFAGPEQVLDYLGRYTHRVAISNNRLLGLNDTQVRFRYRDYAHGNRRKVMTLEADEFIRRFLLHVLPAGFMRIRHYGILANRAKATKLNQARAALACPAPQLSSKPESVEDFWLRVAARDIHRCPHCKTGRMIVVGAIAPARARAPP